MLGGLARRFVNLAHLAFGGSCYLCRGVADGVLCAQCDAELPRLEGALCPRCALPSPAGETCGQCLAQPPAYDATVAALAYEFPCDVLVQGLKFRGELALAPLLGGLLAARLPRDARADFILPVPLAAARLRVRGFNQSLEIARAVAAATGCRLAPLAAERGRDTPAQLDLPLAERARNVRGAFRCAAPFAGAEVALVDDVMTTGATLAELAATLKRAGAARVVNWVVARTAPHAHA
ncbi:MAG: ComF family protein [Betaproteobacteria bacterium]|nr:ComF family protein [Betaproteobacteria bacterium]MDH5221091.1 ComF family protein [Betaproteobacteria bacterium]MDH5349197.1 ComF family protein [Betaproteobacteria bacterium]